MSEENPAEGDHRRSSIITALREGVRRVDDLARACGVSTMTIRRDLQLLEQRNEIRRVRGGAVPVDAWTFDHRRGRSAAAKDAIAAKLRPFLPDRGGIGFDGSTTAHSLARLLKERPVHDLTAVTTGFETFHELSRTPGCRAYATGGTADPHTGSLVGPLAQMTLQQFALHTCFLSATCLDDSIGSTEFTADEAAVKRAMTAVSQRTVLAVDSSKLGRRAVAKCLPLEEIDILVTDMDPLDERLEPYRGVVELV
ncbi:DeoR/GlpR family DNA-binding transcription regulator [Streptomyces sp. JH34]|uniref:DeoR/GlpR family DNA-binding transcription regulator n=1 Tax=unclassified Streptomyces TaxID=2593676 RepID=UPI0023F7E875|nr:DeoR/GlpR family DNA-binding transcription regulator [Streptomyces sp. JH34]MDF6022592.1 DeoR/GlpR family DNA-binding transcription regulator [Streptomyces sp. JH34]